MSDKKGIFAKKKMEQLPFEIKDKQAIIFIGIQASGKTTFYNQMLSGYTHISLDVLNTRNKENIALNECLNNGRSFVIDNTNPEIADRAGYIKKAKEFGYQVIGIFFQSKVRDCVLRNEQRGGKVPQKAIACTSNKLQLPSTMEGFDELYFVRIENNTFEISTWEE
jgi:predicted kinase